MNRAVDVVIVGGGIAGCALARALAGAGLGVVVLERQTSYRDKVRGEYLHPWGVAEARRLGVDEILAEAGGCWITEGIGYDELVDPADAAALPLAAMRPDVPGAMDLGHPQSCAALAEAATVAGAQLIRGVGDVAIKSALTPTVCFELDDVEHEVSCRLVVGADGRASSVRRQLGLTLHHTQPRTWGAGMLAAGLDALPMHRSMLGSEGDVHYLVFPRPGGVARLYLWHDLEQAERFTGPDRQREFLDAFRLDCLPFADDIAGAEPAGPCAKYQMNDTWTDTIVAPGVVLVGDAAGYNDAIIGEGLSIALRDARTVAETLLENEDWSPSMFDDYANERSERMKRLRICAALHTDLRCTFTPAGRAHRGAVFAAIDNDPLVAATLFVTAIAGPEAAPAEAFEDAHLDRLHAL